MERNAHLFRLFEEEEEIRLTLFAKAEVEVEEEDGNLEDLRGEPGS